MFEYRRLRPCCLQTLENHARRRGINHLGEGARYEIEEILADGEGFVVARVRLVGHGARSGAPVALRWVAVAWIHDGKMTRSAGYLGRREALEAGGLEE